MNYLDLQHVLEKELIVAVGCTEPIAIAYAAAVAAEQTTAPIRKIKIACSRNVIKNAMAVAIPGRTYTGIAFVGALGAIVKGSEKTLSLLEGVTSLEEEEAVALCNSGTVEVTEVTSPKVLVIDVTIETDHEKVEVLIEDEHTNITSLKVNGIEQMAQESADKGKESNTEDISFTLDDIVSFALKCPLSKLELVKKSIDMNLAVANHGLENEYGLQVGRMIKEQMEEGLLSDDLANHAMSYASAGSDARMGGATLPVMANSGSGNQGIAVTMPVVAVARKLEADEEKMIRAVAISHLIAIFIKNQFGRLSALCGVTIAGASSAAAITYLLGGNTEQMYYAIQNTLGNVTGMLCDGAKAGCAMKVATCSGAAVQAALLAKRGICISGTDGFIEKDVNDTIRNFSQIGNEGSPILDTIVLKQMLNKKS
ncbi:L-cysteine desulfidase family protein [Bacillus testis]|uniref:L-cysteine desulfidase family protein n=1 Tax=Bacillus testis TaxID=1622072 RepID=UPI00067F25CD|nr:L-serine ammonia-lyase, iron-sulfur-dependent, subunit alpha [Bacillus testis]